MWQFDYYHIWIPGDLVCDQNFLGGIQNCGENMVGTVQWSVSSSKVWLIELQNLHFLWNFMDVDLHKSKSYQNVVTWNWKCSLNVENKAPGSMRRLFSCVLAEIIKCFWIVSQREFFSSSSSWDSCIIKYPIELTSVFNVKRD